MKRIARIAIAIGALTASSAFAAARDDLAAFTTDLKGLQVYDPDLEQATRRAQGAAEQGSPLAALIDPKRLDSDYIVSEAGKADGLEWLSLKPRNGEGAGFESARLGFGAQGLEKMQFIDALGQKSVIDFGKWNRNPAFDKSTFSFDPPKGVDVIEG